MDDREIQEGIRQILNRELTDGQRRKDAGQRIGKDIVTAARLSMSAIDLVDDSLPTDQYLDQAILRVEEQRGDYRRLYYDDDGYGNGTFGAILSGLRNLRRGTK